MTRPTELLKQFMMTNQLVEHDLDRVENEFSIDLGRGHRAQTESDESYYPQIEASIRTDAARMAPHYEIIYSLERSIRILVSDTITEVEGVDWWSSTNRVPSRIKTEAEGRQQREIDTAMTRRSEEALDFTTFGELGEIIKSNWDLFGGMFTSIRAVEKVMANLNSLRGPIAHCGLLAEDEVLRLRLAIRDWFRLMD